MVMEFLHCLQEIVQRQIIFIVNSCIKVTIRIGAICMKNNLLIPNLLGLFKNFV